MEKGIKLNNVYLNTFQSSNLKNDRNFFFFDISHIIEIFILFMIITEQMSEPVYPKFYKLNSKLHFIIFILILFILMIISQDVNFFILFYLFLNSTLL